MTYQHPAQLNVMPLLALGPYPAIRLIETAKKFETRLVAVVPNSVLQHPLVEIKPSDGVTGIRRRIFLPQSLEDSPRFGLFLKEADDLIDFVRDNIPILVLV